LTKRAQKGIVIGVVAAALAIGGGAAVAGGALGSGGDQQAFLDAAAKRLGVTPAELKAALQGAYGDRLDAAVAAGKITKEQADAMKQRAKEGVLPLFGGKHRGGGHRGAPSLAAAAGYLGLTEAKLRAELESGKTLAQIAKAENKPVDGLKKALAAESKKRLDAAVKAGRLTQAQADAIQAQVTEHLDDLVNGTAGPGRRHGDGHRGGGHGWGGRPAAGAQPPAASIPVAPAVSAA
jgi:hypothetical protein